LQFELMIIAMAIIRIVDGPRQATAFWASYTPDGQPAAAGHRNRQR
jgi:hypothetical protein